MISYLVLFLQHNIARRHEPTAALSALLRELAPFSFLKRDRVYLERAIEQSVFPEVLGVLRQYVGSEGFLPRVVPVALIQEPVLHEGVPVGFKDFQVLFGAKNPRAAIITLNCLRIIPVTNNSGRDTILALVKARDKTYLIGSFYFDLAEREVQIDTTGWQTLASGVILAGDSNAHSTLWGSERNNTRGDAWEEFILANDLEILNVGRDYTFENHLGKSMIDISLSRNTKAEAWQNTGQQFGSDHFMLLFVLPCSPGTDNRTFQNVANTDWNRFLSSLPEINPTDIISTSHLEERARLLINNIRKAFDIACPHKKALPVKPCRWWNENLAVLLRKKNIAAKEARRYDGRMRGVIARNKKIALGRLFNKALKLAKKESWQRFISNVKDVRNVASMFKSIGVRDQAAMPLLKKPDGEWARNAEENLEILRTSHFNNSTTTYGINCGNDVPFRSDLPNGLEAFLSWEMLKKAIDELPTGKAPGPDGIRNEALKRLPYQYQAELLQQFKFSIRSSFIPTSWLNINTIYIKKTGKPNQDCPRTYRPIGLSSCILKLCERLINWRLKHTVLADGSP